MIIQFFVLVKKVFFLGIIQKDKYYQVFCVIKKKKKKFSLKYEKWKIIKYFALSKKCFFSGYNMKNEILLSVLCFFFFFEGII